MGHKKLFVSATEEEFIEFIVNMDGDMFINIYNEEFGLERFFTIQLEDIKPIIKEINNQINNNINLNKKNNG